MAVLLVCAGAVGWVFAGSTTAAFVVFGMVVLLAILIYILTAPEQQVVLAISVATAVQIVLVPNYGPPVLLKAGPPLVLILLAVVARTRLTTRIPPMALNARLILAYLTYAFVVTSLESASSTAYGVLLVILTITPLVLIMPALDRRHFQRFLVAVCGLAIAEALLGLSELRGYTTPLWGLLGKPVPTYGNENNLLGGFDGRAMATMAEPIPLGMFLAFSVAFACAIWKLRGGWLFTVNALLIIGIFATGSRSSLIAAGAILIGLYLTGRGRHAVNPVRAFVIIAIAVAASTAVDVPHLIGLRDVSDTLSYQHREKSLGTFSGVFDGGLQHLIFGTPPSTAQNLDFLGYLSADGVQTLDNTWAQLLLQTGLIGLGLIVAAFVVTLRDGNRSQRIAFIALAIFSFSFDIYSWNIALLIALTVMHHHFGVTSRNRGTPAPTEQEPAIATNTPGWIRTARGR